MGDQFSLLVAVNRSGVSLAKSGGCESLPLISVPAGRTRNRNTEEPSGKTDNSADEEYVPVSASPYNNCLHNDADVTDLLIILCFVRQQTRARRSWRSLGEHLSLLCVSSSRWPIGSYSIVRRRCFPPQADMDKPRCRVLGSLAVACKTKAISSEDVLLKILAGNLWL